MGTDEIAYQNKDITNKALTEQMLAVERTFFFKLGGKGIFQRLERKVGQNECLDDWELMEFIMLFLSCRAKVEGEKKIQRRKIADIWIENDWTKEVFTKTNEKSDTDKVADSIIRKFSDILNTIGFSKEEINWYKSDSANGEGGKFIFTGDNVAFELKELLKIFKKRTVTITSEERDKIIEYLTDILPVLRSEKDAKQAKQMAKSLIETEKTRRFSEPTSLMSHDFSHLREKLNNNTPKRRIEEIVNGYYVKDIHTRMADLFESRIFVKVSKRNIPRRTSMRTMYEYQYALVKQ